VSVGSRDKVIQLIQMALLVTSGGNMAFHDIADGKIRSRFLRAFESELFWPANILTDNLEDDTLPQADESIEDESASEATPLTSRLLTIYTTKKLKRSTDVPAFLSDYSSTLIIHLIV